MTSILTFMLSFGIGWCSYTIIKEVLWHRLIKRRDWHNPPAPQYVVIYFPKAKRWDLVEETTKTTIMSHVHLHEIEQFLEYHDANKS